MHMNFSIIYSILVVIFYSVGRVRFSEKNCLLIVAERREEKEKSDKQRNKSSNNHLQLNGDGQHNRITAAINFNVNNDLGINPIADETWIHELFQGTLVSTTKCLNCETVFQSVLRKTKFNLNYLGQQ